MDSSELRAKWMPAGEGALRAAFAGGLLEERNWCELKAKLGEPTKGNNTEAAKDMASLAVDGGTLIYGIDEAAPGGDPLHPFDVGGLPERVGQIAALRIDPPLVVECTTVYHDREAGKGYLLVHVPASPLAPHQVDGRYYGRDDKSKRALSDPEVERLFRRRERWHEGVAGLLADVVAEDRFGTGQRYPHFFLVGRPVTPRDEMARRIVGDPGWQTQVIALQRAVRTDQGVRDILTAWYPGHEIEPLLARLRGQFKTADGVLLTTAAVAGRQPQQMPEEFTDELEVRVDGEIRFYSSHMGEPGQSPQGVTSPGLYLEAVVTAVRELLAITLEISRRTGYAGMWDLGAAVTGIAGARVAPWVKTMSAPFIFATGYTRNDYHRGTRASTAELEQVPGAVAERLLGSLIRGLNASSPRVAVALSDAAR